MLRVSKILCPVDFSDTSKAALRFAVELADRFGAQLTLLHVYQPPAYQFPDGVIMAGPEVLNDLETQVDNALDRWKLEAEQIGHVPIATQSAIGGTHSEIIRVAGEGGYDLIVMGTHGRTGIRHALLGSVAERVVRHAGCPVLTVRSPEAGAAHTGA
jgi:nucleotide-binding universal stress UspA family protein